MANNSLTYTLLIICALILCTVTAIFVCKRISRNRPFLNTDTPPSVSDLRSTVCSLIENLPDGVIVLDKDSRISDINSAAVRLIGYDLLSENNP
jgi:PAS domain-containing protein